MAIKRLEIEGLRGFSEKIGIDFSVPDGINFGSGLTVLVGPNNSGKSTIIEAIHMLSMGTNIIPISSRNAHCDYRVEIKVIDEVGVEKCISSTENNGAFVERKSGDILLSKDYRNILKTYILSSKRGFSSTFSAGSSQNRDWYAGNVNEQNYRNEGSVNHNFGGRLLRIMRDRQRFDECLIKVLDPLPNWTIEANSHDQLYLEFAFEDLKHSSNGAGDGFINIFNIVDALYDSSEDNVIIIDEPEISLHPDLQRKVFKLLVEYSKNKQIIISTHSPYFVDWNLFSKYSKIIRLKKENGSIFAYELSDYSKNKVQGFLNDSSNPHVLSLTTNEIFFLNDNVILTEGQEDVLCYRQIFEKKEYIPNASFFGWGAGGAEKILFILKILNDLGYKKVFTILDGDKTQYIDEINTHYPNYSCYAILANDVRNKPIHRNAEKLIEEVNEMNIDDSIKMELIDMIKSRFPYKDGLVNNMKDFEINPIYDTDINCLINEMKKYFYNNKTNELLVKNNIYQSFDEEQLAEELLTDYSRKVESFELIKNKYNYLNFIGCGGRGVSFGKIKNNIFYAIHEVSYEVSEDMILKIQFHYRINIKKRKVKLVKKKILNNTLPKRY